MSHERRAGQALLVLCLAAYAFIIPRGAQHNADSRLALTYALVERGTLWVDGFATNTVDRALRDGHVYTDKAPGLSVWLAPLYAALRLLPLTDQSLPANERYLTRYLLTFLGVGVPHALFAVWLFHRLRASAPDIWPRAAVVVGYALASPAYAYSVHAFGHVPAGACLFAGAALLASAGPRAAVAGGALLAGAVTFEYPAAVPALLLTALSLWHASTPDRHWTARAPLAAAGALPVLGALGLYHTAAFGAPWLTGYAFVDPSGPFSTIHSAALAGVGVPDPRVVVELLTGAQRGLLVVAPWLALAVPGAFLIASKRDLANGLTVSISLLAINAGYVVWDGGASWGPRHLTAALPFLAVVALPAVDRWRLVAGALIAVSLVLTCVAVATGTLPPSGSSALGDFVLPALSSGRAGNTLGALLGLAGWRAVVLLAAIALVCWIWGRGVRATYGVACAASFALIATLRLDASYVEYAEGYYLYLASRIANGAVLYRDAESTQTPLVPLIAAGLWRVLPDVFAPRLFAIACHLVSALLAGRLALRLSGRTAAAPLAVILASLLPLGASSPAALDANALLAPLAAALALLLTISPHHPHRAAASLIAVAGVAAKLTFVPLALAALAVAPRRSAASTALLLVALCSVALALFLWSGPAALDAIAGELEGPYLPAAALLSLLQYVRLEGAALPLAGVALWQLRRDATLRPVHAIALAASSMPLLAVHQGTFVSVARPAEPLIAAYAVTGIFLLADRAPAARVVIRAALLVAAAALPLTAIAQAQPASARPSETPMQWIRAHSRHGEPLVVPPYFAARAGHPMPFDYADWTVLGMRAAAGVAPEQAYSSILVGNLSRAAYPLVISDFRLGYIPGAAAALETGYAPAARVGEGPLLLTLWLPRGGATQR